jgi:hypothetical protein
MGGYVLSVRTTPNADRHNRWWVSPAVPTIGNAALLVLWVFSAFGGWGATAFCGELAGADCRAGFEATVALSVPIAALSAAIAVAAWAVPWIRRNPARLGGALVVAALGWVIAEGLLFGGGWMAQH